jgi:PBSX family phage terminase large subunit
MLVGGDVANEENLIQNRTDITPEERRDNARKAGIASGEARRRKRDMQNSMQALLNMKLPEHMMDTLERLGLASNDTTYIDMINVCAMQQAMKGNVRAMEFIRDTAGFNPETVLKERMFEYEKEREAGAATEIEDISDVLVNIFGYEAWGEILNDGVVCMPIKTIAYNFGGKHLDYIRKCHDATYNIAEGAVRAGKTVDNVIAFAYELCRAPDKFHLATGSTMANAKLNIGDANGFGLEYIFRGQCRWSKYKDNDCLIVRGPYTNFEEKVVIFAGGKSSDSYKKIRGNSYGMWIATEINLHHDNTIKEAFNRQLAAKMIKIFWDLNPEHPKAPIYVDYLDKWAEKHMVGNLVGGYNYEHFTIFDNINITPERIEEIVSRYDPGSIWYIRDIEGKRSIAEGLIYSKLATSIAADDKAFFMSKKDAQEIARTNGFVKINVGVDFGGNGSGHAFVAVGETLGYERLIILRSERYVEGAIDPETQKRVQDIDPEDLGRLFVQFVNRIIEDYGFVTKVYADSAEQVLIRGLKKSLARANIGNIKIVNALKSKITNRIFATTALTAMGRLFYTEECATYTEAASMAVWNPKNMELERLDDGTSDIDTLDAFEYTFERDIDKFIKKAI